MYCSKCGSKIDERSAWCMTCGAPVRMESRSASEKTNGTAQDPFSGYDPYTQADMNGNRNPYGNGGDPVPDSFFGPVREDRSFVTFLLLSFITCGIYGIFFLYSLTEDVNVLCEGDGKYSMNYLGVVLLSIVTCGIYAFIWRYQIGERIKNTALRKYGIRSNTDGVQLLALSLCGTVSCGICNYISNYELITAVNQLAAAYNKTGR